MQIKFKKLLTGLLLLGAFSSAHADMTVTEYKQLKKQSENADLLSMYVRGISEGFAYMNIQLDARKAKRVFCLPNNKVLSYADLDNIVSREVKELDEFKKKIGPKAEKAEFTIPPLLLSGLREDYPCRK